jgi:Ca2+-binding RTX toxin-like protein
MPRIIGDAHDDHLFGEDGDDHIEGRGGDDALSGGDGNDVIEGGADDDDVYGGLGDDTIFGGAGNDMIEPDEGVDVVSGGDGDDLIYVRPLADDGSDVDSLSGGDGFDRIATDAGWGDLPLSVVFTLDGEVIVNGEVSAIAAGFEGALFRSSGNIGHHAVGSSGYDSFDTAYGNDTLFGRAGDDQISSGSGRDRIDGGAGADSIIIEDGGRDRIDLGAGDDALELEFRGGLYERGGRYDGGGGHDTIDVDVYLDWEHSLSFDGSAIFLDGKVVAEVENFEAIEITGRRVRGLAGDDRIDGTSQADRLLGLDGGDDMLGGAGRDTLLAGAGDDEMYVELDLSRDVLDGGEGLDALEFGPVSQAIVMRGDLQSGVTITLGGEIAATVKRFETLWASGSAGDDRLLGGTAADAVSVGLGRDVVRTFGGDDRLDLELDRRIDRIDLGAGIDRAIIEERDGADVAVANEDGVTIVTVDGHEAARIANAERFLIETGDGDDRLQGGADADLLSAGTGHNALKGHEGDDGLAVELDAARDRILGGSGDDALVVKPAFGFADDFGDALVTEVMGDGAFRITLAGRTLLEAESVERVELSDSRGADLLIGQSMADVLRSIWNEDTLIGGAGDDTLIGSEATARMAGGEGLDAADLTLFSSFELAIDSHGVAAVFRSYNGDELTRLVGVENVIGGYGHDSITGDAGDNVIEGFEGNDTLDGGDGVDTLSFASPLNFDVMVRLAGSSDAIASERNPSDELAFRDVVRNFENVIGGGGDDFIAGDDGDNRLAGGDGYDTLTGGGGADTFAFDDEPTPDDIKQFDQVRGFSSAEGDRLDLTALAAQSENATPGVLAFIGREAFSGAGGEVRYERNGGTTIVLVDLDGDRDADQPIELAGRMELSEGDFILG